MHHAPTFAARDHTARPIARLDHRSTRTPISALIDQERGMTVVARYNLAYISHSICHVDNGRVLGFHNAHDYHHRHCMGEVEAVEFISYEASLETFQQEWLAIVKGERGKKS
jgi:hypothetical protein